MKVVLFPNFIKKNALPTELKCIDILNKHGIGVLIPESCKNEFSDKEFVTYGQLEAITEECDVMIAIGGDGTILRASAYASEYDKLLLGINTGTLGFLAEYNIEDMCRDTWNWQSNNPNGYNN